MRKCDFNSPRPVERSNDVRYPANSSAISGVVTHQFHQWQRCDPTRVCRRPPSHHPQWKHVTFSCTASSTFSASTAPHATIPTAAHLDNCMNWDVCSRLVRSQIARRRTFLDPGAILPVREPGQHLAAPRHTPGRGDRHWSRVEELTWLHRR